MVQASDMDYPRILLLVAGAAAGVWVGWQFEVSTEALRILSTVFSVLVGMMIGLLHLVGDPGSLLSGTWRVADADARSRRKMFPRYMLLIYAYLITVMLAFGASLMGDTLPPWTGRVAQGFGGGALVWSLGLPIALYRVNCDRLHEEVERRKREQIERRKREEIESQRREEIENQKQRDRMPPS